MADFDGFRGVSAGFSQDAKDPGKGKSGARQSIGFQFDVKDAMLGAVLKYKDLQEAGLKT